MARRNGKPKQLTSVVDLAATRIYRLEQLVDFLITHLFAEVREDCRRTLCQSEVFQIKDIYNSLLYLS